MEGADKGPGEGIQSLYALFCVFEMGKTPYSTNKNNECENGS